MFVKYDELSEDAKIWVYPSNRKFYSQELGELEDKLKRFVSAWKYDDENFKVSYKLFYNRFIVFLVEEGVSLLSSDVDKQVTFILELEQAFKVALLDKMNVCFKQGEFVQYKDLKDFKKLLKNKAITGKSIVFDNLIQTKYELENYWEVPIKDSWYKRFL
ncbi:ABC transporter ATPase [Tenacibaculum maritimum]|uniref:ABC transporter ATPase n=1 Tax=Tenacibaculum maritimum TaxID=107401 RepID=UPI00230767D1|nr:ABC transporter ATPase [Tenacibaculum maritimum]MDB0600462.1 ABC transporter ATPase [Tenacibaculum maritimum]MDB0610616.1 ABC transporter ATPase [Tenacibaculum maritimum]